MILPDADDALPQLALSEVEGGRTLIRWREQLQVAGGR